MTDTIYDERAEMLKKKISLLEWDLSIISDATIIKQKQASLQTLRSELEGIKKISFRN